MLAHLCDTCRTALDAAATRCPDCGEPRPRGGWALDPHLGRLLAKRYRLLERLGEGGYGTVYRAIDEGAPGADEIGEVAVKMLTAHASGAERRRFLNEARAARSLNNPHIVKIYDFGVAEDVPFLVMERLQGETVADQLRAHGVLPIERTLAIARQVCAALQEAHAAGIVHRDIKPDNLMLLAPDLRFVKVLDFGAVARVKGPDATRSIIGTPHYMAPEQIEQRPIDGRTDIYALGISMFRMLSGRLPYDGDTILSVMNAHLNDRIPQLTDEPTKLGDLVARLMAKSQEGRPPSLEQVDALLADLASTEASTLPITPQQPMAMARTVSLRSVVSRRPRLALFAVLLLVAAAVALWSGSSPRRTAATALTASFTPQLAPPTATSAVLPAPTAPSASDRGAPTAAPRAAPHPSPAAPPPAAGGGGQAPQSSPSVPRAGKLHEDEF